MAYDENFYKKFEDESVRTAQAIVPLLMDWVMPQSVIDVGCGIGAWLEAFKQRGCKIHGLDGDYVKRDMLRIDPSEFHPADLTNPVTVSEKFDLATSIEVAEHLPQERAISFVRDLTNLSDVVCFSAAIPTQEGDGHINCQWQSYWAAIFRHYGYVVVDCIRPRVWGGNISIVRQNILLYVKQDKLFKYPCLWEYFMHKKENILDIVSPELFIGYQIKMSREIKRLREENQRLKQELQK